MRTCCYNGESANAVLFRHFFESDSLSRFYGIGLAVCLGLTAAGCSGPATTPPREIAYVRGAAVPLRDQLGPAANLTGNLESGEEVEVLAKRPRWAQVRSARGQTGWVQSRLLAPREVHDQFRSVAAQAGSLPSQGKALLRREANLHLEPRREAETFYRLPEGEEMDVVAHRVAERPSPSLPSRSSPPAEEGLEPPASADLAVQPLEDWFLVRASRGRTGWLLENFLDMNVPVEVARYREGLRIRAWFVIHREMDDGVERPWYLWASIRPVSGFPFDFDEIRVFVWNPARDRYETAYRERNLIGFYPIRVGSQATPGGPAPSFALQREDETGKRFEKAYVMAGRMVRRTP